MTELHIDNLSKKLDESLVIKDTSFGDITVKYRINQLSPSTYFLVYSFDGLVDNEGIEIRFDVNMIDIHEDVGGDLTIYFKNCIRFINDQLKFLEETEEGRNIVLEGQEKNLMDYFKEKINNRYVQDLQKII